jgi:putative FmdB family regulatory protein
MPFYEYECRACGHRFEEFQKITDKPVRTCPECGRRRVQRLISHTSFVLKGSGWYVTDYARKGSGSGGSGGEKDGAPRSEGSGKKKDGTQEKKDAASAGA